MTLVKICAITNAEDAQCAVTAGADLIGVIFAEKSRRCVSVEAAVKIVDAIKPLKRERAPLERSTTNQSAFAQALCAAAISTNRPLVVGVFQDQAVDFINQTATQVGLDLIQLHGSEEPDLPSQLIRPVIRAIGVHQDSTATDLYNKSILPHLNHAHLFLLDTKSSSGFGGLGTSFDWKIAEEIGQTYKLPFILAGGLEPDNIARAIKQARPLAVDVASGVELKDSVGRKDHRKVFEFLEQSKRKVA